MTKITGHNHSENHQPEKLFEQFQDEERSQVEQIWEKSSRIEEQGPEVTDAEIEEALGEVHRKIGNGHSSKKSGYDTGINWQRWRVYLSAAAILIVIGLGFFYIPVSINVPHGEIASIELPDGSQVELNSGTTLQYSRLFFLGERSVELDGEAYFRVDSDDSPFTVNANNSTVRVTGTRFNIRSWSSDPGSATVVTVTEGRVEFYPSDQRDQIVSLREGESSRWNTELARPTDPEPVSIDHVTAWRDHMLVFNEKPLIVIFRELERRFGVEIELDASGLEFDTLTTYYSDPQNIETVLNDISMVKGLRYAETANGYRVYK